MTAGFLASFGSLCLFFLLLHIGVYVLTRTSKSAARPQLDIRDSLTRAEAAAKQLEAELARIRNAVAG